MRTFDVTIRVRAANSSDAVNVALDDLRWDYFGDEPADIWHEVVGVAEKVGE